MLFQSRKSISQLLLDQQIYELILGHTVSHVRSGTLPTFRTGRVLLMPKANINMEVNGMERLCFHKTFPSQQTFLEPRKLLKVTFMNKSLQQTLGSDISVLSFSPALQIIFVQQILLFVYSNECRYHKKNIHRDYFSNRFCRVELRSFGFPAQAVSFCGVVPHPLALCRSSFSLAHSATLVPLSSV